ncbi:transcriptional regulator, DeoR family [Arboricoccus pini]|uniref:Transcriptional regulator, DeoR family n=1 Tax=Arboricoccus pini TaxID=1963835 RepID=A0A212RN65_9PROT|nr:DeoR/GlpR family DNA-binding transcription regulator [Arboricoccus pini]SNB73925.1 transcriptional regulator, DeoR family [Arboricoccus pini]
MKLNRQAALRRHLYLDEAVSVADLAQRIGASLATVRRDLQELEAQGVVARSHGGARLLQGAATELAFRLREQQRLDAKKAIALAAYALIRPQSTIFLDAGTTVLQLARQIRLDPIPLTIVTNGLPVAQELVEVEGIKVIMLAGQIRDENLSLIGPLAEATLERLHVDQLFLGASAIADDLNIYGRDMTEARLNERMLAHASDRLLLADAAKFGCHDSYLVAPLSSVGQIVVDAALSTVWRSRIAEAGIGLVEASGAAEA